MIRAALLTRLLLWGTICTGGVSAYSQAPAELPAPVLEAVSTTFVVAADGSGEFRTIQSAIDAAPQNSGRTLIRIRPGIYREKLLIPGDRERVTLLGEDQISTIVSFAHCADSPGADGVNVGTVQSASVTVLGRDFSAENLTIQNSHGAGSQAVALRIAADRAVIRRCRILGWQDTLLVESGRQLFEDCFIAGHVDFIFGGATAFFDRCRIHALSSGFITAPSTPAEQDHGLVFSKCRVTAEPDAQIYLGRPWRAHGSAVFVSCSLPAAVRVEGWHNWDDPTREETARFAEFGNRGPGADTARRVNWSRKLTPEQAEGITLQTVLAGGDAWNPAAVPFVHQPGSQISDAPSAARFDRLPQEEANAWRAYVAESEKRLAEDKQALSRELLAVGLPIPLAAPNSSKLQLNLNAPEAWYASDEAKALARVVISFQTPSGGWSKAVAYDKGERADGMQWASQASESSWHYVGTFDNGATIQQLRFLARVRQWAADEEVNRALNRGLDYVLAAQYPSGGWPQVYPLEGGYHDAITFNDDSMVRVLEFLWDLSEGRIHGFDEAQQARAAAALERGIACILKSQIRQNGRPTAWCAQHDSITLAPVAARLKEPASISGGESVAIVRFLLKLENRTPEIDSAIQYAREWFRRTAITGLRATERDGRGFWEPDSSGTGTVWARFYDVLSNQPLFAGAQDGIVYDNFETMWRNNRFGYDFYTDKPKTILTDGGAKP